MIKSTVNRAIAGGLVLAALAVAGGCAPPFSQAALDRVDRTVSFKELREDPDHYRGTWVMLAGVVVETRNTPEGSFIEVLQKPMDRRSRPLETDETGGRFMIYSAKFLDAAVYHKGKRISVVGEVTGVKTQPLGEIQYQYPVVGAKELTTWEPSSGPHFVFGVGAVFHGR